MSARPARLVLALLLWGAGAGGCDEAEAITGPCGESECVVTDDRDALLSELQSHADPMASVLRQLADERAVVAGDWAELVHAASAELGCAAREQRAFVVQSNLSLAPKSVLTHCSEMPQQASRMFTVFEPNAQRDDLDGETLRVAAWDEEAQQYRRYQLAPHPEGGLGVMVEPAFCVGCHGSRVGGAAWTPIMNEMTNPWAQWHAEPAFASFAFDSDAVEQLAGPSYQEITTDRLDSVSNLEPIVRAALDRVVAAEIADRQDAPALAVAKQLLAPVFCDPSVNFVSEVHDGGEIRASAVLDPGIMRAYRSLDPAGWPWTWVYDDVVHLEPVADGEQPLVLVATRSEASVQAEAALRSRNVLTAMDVLRVRALDWQRPVFSGFRCGLFEDAVARAEEGALDVAAMQDNTEVVRALYDEAMQLHTEAEPVSLLPREPDHVVSLAEVDADASLTEAAVTEATVDLQTWGGQIDAHLSVLREPAARAWLHELRIDRGCEARSRFVTAPIVPGTDACP